MEWIWRSQRQSLWQCVPCTPKTRIFWMKALLEPWGLMENHLATASAGTEQPVRWLLLCQQPVTEPEGGLCVWMGKGLNAAKESWMWKHVEILARRARREILGAFLSPVCRGVKQISLSLTGVTLGHYIKRLVKLGASQTSKAQVWSCQTQTELICHRRVKLAQWDQRLVKLGQLLKSVKTLKHTKPLPSPGSGLPCSFLLLVLKEQLQELQAALLASILDMEEYRKGCSSSGPTSPLEWTDGLLLLHSCPPPLDEHLLGLLGCSSVRLLFPIFHPSSLILYSPCFLSSFLSSSPYLILYLILLSGSFPHLFYLLLPPSVLPPVSLHSPAVISNPVSSLLWAC